MKKLIFLILFIFTHSLFPQAYPWQHENSSEAISERIAPPENFQRVAAADSSFAYWLQHLPVKAGNPTVMLFDGRRKPNQTAQVAVIDIDTGSRDLQQCADAVIRLRAEYLYSRQQLAKIHFNFTSGDRADYLQWQKGYRPVIRGNDVRWQKSAAPAENYRSFKRYLNIIFSYAGTASLTRELVPVNDINQIQIGDVFIQGGFPGHAVIVVDMAENSRTGEKCFLMAQSYMPAQDMHILRNPNDPALSPWYSTNFQGSLETPEWTFKKGDLKRFTDR